jgi:hypothetical protein
MLIAQSVDQSLSIPMVEKHLSVMVAPDNQVLRVQLERPVQRELLVLQVQVEAVTERDSVLVPLVLVLVMTMSKLNSSTLLLVDNLR